MTLKTQETPNISSSHSLTDQHRILGAAIRLSQYSAIHRQYPMGFFASRFGTAIRRNRFRCIENQAGELLAFCAWTFIDTDTLDQVLNQGHDPQPEEWRDQGALFFKEFIAPFGHAKLMIADLRKHIFPHVKGHAYGLRGRMGPICISTHKPRVRCFFQH
ncbi:toxin-activating lysine-acyltransferase [bacterium]|jgi:cytolysin-activating lysine-acyltransferase|nr:toxin-activating lysine-acyltransferase [bacterium]